MSRRDFVQVVGVAAASPILIPNPALAHSGRPGPNGKVGIGVIGTGKRAFEILPELLGRDDVRITAVCDVDTTRRDKAKRDVDTKYASTDCATHVDYREVLDRKDIDAVLIATPDHWHASMIIDAAKRKKDIYCEKPLTLKLTEGRLVIEACRKYGVVHQTGSQQRTEYAHQFVKACEYVRSGRIGDLLTVHVGVPTSSKACDLPEEPMEPGLDWDRWLGPAPLRPYNSILSPRGVHGHYPKWRDYWEYSGGLLTDMGAHNFDIAHWGMGMDASGPIEVVPPKNEKSMYGAKLVYASGVEVIHGGPGGITFTGTNGVISVFRDYLKSIPDNILTEPLKAGDVQLPRHKSHVDNFLNCVKNREKPLCDVEVGARSIACAHLCNLAYWHRRRLNWDPVKWESPGDAAANQWLNYEHRKGYELPTF